MKNILLFMFVGMKIKKSVMLSSLFAVMLLLPCFADASWAEDACRTNNLEVKGCEKLSDNYKVPYCVTSFSSDDYESADVDYANNCIWTALTNSISSRPEKKLTIDGYETRDIIELYCKSLYSGSNLGRIYFAKPFGDTWDWRLTFDSHQSLFLHVLCSTFEEKGKKPFIYEDTDLVKDAFNEDLVNLIKLKQMSEGKDKCSLDEDVNLTDCDMTVYATKIYQAIMTDLFKIKYAQVLDVNTTKNFEPDYYKKVLNFMSGYYLMAKTELKQEYIQLKGEYPKTISVLESNQKYYKNVLKTVKIINNSDLSDLADKGCPVGGKVEGMQFIACALHSSQRDGFSLTPSFVTLLHNEILHYRQFMTFYKAWLNLKVESMSRRGYSDKEVRIYQSKLEDFNRYYDMQLDATAWAERGFEEFNMTYPIHIWILLLQEKGAKFRDFNLSPEITLFYSLSEKLQNVQLPNGS